MLARHVFASRIYSAIEFFKKESHLRVGRRLVGGEVPEDLVRRRVSPDPVFVVDDFPVPESDLLLLRPVLLFLALVVVVVVVVVVAVAVVVVAVCVCVSLKCYFNALVWGGT